MMGYGGNALSETPLVDFSRQGEDGCWWAVNDDVMGGVSRGWMRVTGGVGIFEGYTSLENGGGFASVRRQPAEYALGGCCGLRLRVRGDGRTYQLRLRTRDLSEGAAYRARFETVADEWRDVELRWSEFEPVFRGRLLEDAPALDPGGIQQLGFLIADRRAGDFRLEIAALCGLGRDHE